MPVRAVGAKPLSPVATTAKTRVLAVSVVILTFGLSPVVAFWPTASRAQVYPAAAFPLATYTHMVRPPSLGTDTERADPTGGASMYHNSTDVSVTPCRVDASVSATPL